MDDDKRVFSFSDDELMEAEKLNANAETRMTEEYKEFLRQQFGCDEGPEYDPYVTDRSGGCTEYVSCAEDGPDDSPEYDPYVADMPDDCQEYVSSAPDESDPARTKENAAYSGSDTANESDLNCEYEEYHDVSDSDEAEESGSYFEDGTGGDSSESTFQSNLYEPEMSGSFHMDVPDDN